jgi:hypothetical protein
MPSRHVKDQLYLMHSLVFVGNRCIHFMVEVMGMNPFYLKMMVEGSS